jgi:hypothetical protein
MVANVETCLMSRIVLGLSRIPQKSRRASGAGSGEGHVARLFVPAYDGGIAIKVPVRQTRNSDARRRLARLFESRRILS